MIIHRFGCMRGLDPHAKCTCGTLPDEPDTYDQIRKTMPYVNTASVQDVPLEGYALEIQRVVAEFLRCPKASTFDKLTPLVREYQERWMTGRAS